MPSWAAVFEARANVVSFGPPQRQAKPCSASSGANPPLCLPLLRGRTQPAVRGCQQTPRRCRALSGGREALAPGLQLSRISAGPCAGWFQHAPLCWGSLETARVLQWGRSCPGCAHAGADERRAWLAGRLHRPAELIPIDSRSPIVIPDDKERGELGSAAPQDQSQASLLSPCVT